MKRVSMLIATACGLVIMGLALLWQGVNGTETAADWLRKLSNCALLAGVVITGIGLLAWVSDEHFFDGIRYAVSSLFANLRGKPKRYDTYYDYIHRERKKGKRFSLIAPGLIFLGLAVVLTVLFYLARS